ncbi:MAG TPA: glycosyltransferase [Flavobacteriales bacterium]|nr:glycosyltransferase [Flavobacteriales bacterium]HIA12246.1 glycosyltransferase [Flavobacteriales bacterium]
MAYLILTGIFTFTYCVLMLFYIRGWRKLSGKESRPTTHPSTRISVIVAVRNEEKVIKNCLLHLAQQDYPTHLFEVLVINDYCSDSTVQVAGLAITSNSDFNCEILELRGESQLTNNKKEAISHGVAEASGELIVTTDADCTMGKSWLSAIAAYYETNRPKMISAPVVFKAQPTLAGNLQGLEFIGLVAAGAASIAIGHPVMCNGANLAYEKTAFNQVRGFAEDESASGDDLFLMYKIAKLYPDGVRFLKSDKAIVTVQPEQTIKGFINQRMRWASKAKLLKDAHSFIVAIIVYATNLLVLIGAFCLILLPDFNELLFILIFSAKFIIDFIFLFIATSFFKMGSLMWYFVPAEILNVFYVSTIGLIGSVKQYSWKN